MKSIAIISLAIALMLVPLMVVNCNCAGDTDAIERVINDKWDAYNKGDYARALTYCTNYDDANDEIAQMTAMKNTKGNITVQSIEDVYIKGSSAIANVTFYIAGQPDTDEVKLVKKDGSWKIDLEEGDKYGPAEELKTIQLAVTAAMVQARAGLIDGGTIDSTACTVTYDGGIPLPVADYITGGIESLTYAYYIDTDGLVTATSGPLAE